MKDVEFVSQILLRLETEPKGYNAEELDEEFGKRDDDWEFEENVSQRFKDTIIEIKSMVERDADFIISRSRFKNQADFYTLVGAIDSLKQENILPNTETINLRLISFINYEIIDASEQDIKDYYEYVRAASNRTLARKERERILKRVLIGEIAL